MALAVHPRRFTVDDYYAMGDAGIFEPDERVELLDGEILTLPPVGPPHAGSVNRLIALLQVRFGTRAIVQVQNPVRLSNESEPQPDIALLRARDDFYSSRHPTPADTLALIEVAETSLAYDRGKKMRAYARSGITEYWIVNLQHDRLEVYREPQGTGYVASFVATRGESVNFQAFPEDPLSVDETLGATGSIPET